MQERTNQYLLQGFSVTSQTAETTTLVKQPIVGTTNLFATMKSWTFGQIIALVLLSDCSKNPRCSMRECPRLGFLAA